MVDDFAGAGELVAHTGFAPIQILAAAALDASSNREIFGEALFTSIMELVSSTAETLVKHGARLSLDEPPTVRSTTRKTSPVGDSSVGNEEAGMEFPPVDRSYLKIQANMELEELLGMDRLKSAQLVWNAVKTVKSSGLAIIHQDTKSAIADSEAPGGSDEKNCFICWKQFGTIMNRRHRCRITKRHVCDECSSRRIVENGEEHRISDGQFLLARQDESKQESLRLEAEREQERIRLSGSQQHAGSAAARLSRLEAEERAQRESLFGGVMENMAKAVFGGESDGKDGASSTGNEVQGLSASLGQTRDALNDRGEKLNSLAEKSDRLVNASKDFAAMAKELNKSSKNQGLFW